MTDRFQNAIDEVAARREAPKESIRRTQEAIERSRRLLAETDPHPEGPRDGDGTAPPGEPGPPAE